MECSRHAIEYSLYCHTSNSNRDISITALILLFYFLGLEIMGLSKDYSDLIFRTSVYIQACISRVFKLSVSII